MVGTKMPLVALALLLGGAASEPEGPMRWDEEGRELGRGAPQLEKQVKNFQALFESGVRLNQGNKSNIDKVVTIVVDQIKGMIMPAIEEEHKGDVAEYVAAIKNIKSCGIAFETNYEALAATANSTYVNSLTVCKKVEYTRSENASTKHSTLMSWQQGLASLGCPSPLKGVNVATTLGNLGTGKSDYTAVYASGLVYNEAYTVAKAMNDTKAAECKTHQHAFESSWCEAKDLLSTSCTTYNKCYTKQVANFHNQSTSIQHAASSRQAEFKAAKMIMCYVHLLNKTNANEHIDSCHNMVVNASKYEIAVPSVPAKTPCTKTAWDQTILGDQPCTSSWLSTWYTSKSWHSKALADIHCVPCPAEAFAYTS